MHASSIPERIAILLALYCPDVFDLREQFVMCPIPSPHPMSGHPRFAGIELPQLPGTVSIFDGLGELDRHPVVTERGAAGEAIDRPDLFVADLILGVSDEAGPYCLHWSVKSDEKGFKTPQQTSRTFRSPERGQEKFELRMRTERLYFAAAGIPTHEFAANQINAIVVTNLMRLFTWSQRPAPRSPLQARLQALICATDLGSTTPHQLSLYCSNKTGVDQQTFKQVLCALVWTRTLRVDLFASLLFDQPWRPERRDVLDVYRDLFGR